MGHLRPRYSTPDVHVNFLSHFGRGVNLFFFLGGGEFGGLGSGLLGCVVRLWALRQIKMSVVQLPDATSSEGSSSNLKSPEVTKLRVATPSTLSVESCGCATGSDGAGF